MATLLFFSNFRLPKTLVLIFSIKWSTAAFKDPLVFPPILEISTSAYEFLNFI